MPKLSDDTLRLTLLRVAPGTDKDVAQEWCERLKKSNIDATGGAAYMTLGVADLLFICPRRAESHPMLYAPSLPHVLASREMDCYVWVGSQTVSDVVAKPLVAAVFMRHNPDLPVQGGISEVPVELYLAESFERGFDRQQVGPTSAWCFLGTYGRDNNILLVGASEVEDLFRCTQHLIESCAWEPSNKHIPRIRNTFTVIGAKLKQHPDSPIQVEKEFKINVSESGFFTRAEVVLEIGCRAADVLTLIHDAEQFWHHCLGKSAGAMIKINPQVSVIYGPADIHVRFPLGHYQYFGDFIMDLVSFRDHYGSTLLSTEMCIEFPRNHEHKRREYVDIDDQAVETHAVLVDDDLAREILKIDDEAGAILRSIYAYTNRLQDDGGSTIRDMRSFYLDCRNRAESIVEAYNNGIIYDDRLRTLYALLEQGQIGQIQRMENYSPGRPAVSDLGPYRTGIRRILWAAQSIPYHLLTTMIGQSWCGFVVGGRLKDAFRTLPPVMNIPAQTLFHPETWWVLSHEAMHDWVSLRSDKELNFLEEPWKTAFVQITGASDAEHIREDIHSELRWLAIDCLCDALEFLLIHPLDWRDHQRICWALIMPMLETDVCGGRLLSEHLARTTFAMRCDPSMRNLPSATLIDRLKDEVITWLYVRGYKTTQFNKLWENQDFRHEVYKNSNALGNAINWVLKHDPLSNDRRAARATWTKELYPCCRDDLYQGKAVSPDKLVHPDLLVWLLEKECLNPPTGARSPNNKLPSKAATATILSLLWFYLEKCSADFGGPTRK